MKRAAIVIAVVLLTGLCGRLIDFPKVAGGFKADEATYVLQTYSLIEDFNLKYEPRDLLRFNRLYGGKPGGKIIGPEGIFLKQSPHSTASSLDFGKAFAYPLLAAPFAWLGGLGGMFLLNVLLLIVCAWCAGRFAAARVGSVWGWAIGFFFIAASSVPEWSVYLMPEVFNFTLIMVGYFLWLYKEVRPSNEGSAGDFLSSSKSDVAAALIVGLAAYSKITNAPLIVPLIVHALWKRQRKHAAVVAGAFVLSIGVWFGTNIAVTGDWNYQGGVRKTFYGHFPFDASGTTFAGAENSRDNATGGDMPLHSDILMPWQPHFFELAANNTGYFIWGRDAGLIPYYFPGALLCVMWLVKIRRTDAWQVWAFLAAVGTAAILIVMTPYTWNGGGGPPGSRYFLPGYAPMLFLLPATTGAWTAIATGLGGVMFLWPIFGHPFRAAKEPWLHPATIPLRWLPVERTLADDIPARLHPERGRIEFGNPRNALLWMMDGNIYNGEPRPNGGWGFWIAGDADSEMIVRTIFPNARVRITVESPQVDNTFTARWGTARCELTLKKGETQVCDMVADDAVRKRDAFMYSLKMTTTNGFDPNKLVPPQRDDRHNLGVFIMPVFSEK